MKELRAETQVSLTTEHYMSDSQSFHVHEDPYGGGLDITGLLASLPTKVSDLTEWVGSRIGIPNRFPGG